ncbi:MAG: FIST C-terminal domain-containing protein [Kofleriaceae bacterium]|nr:FIST C-terminal domain-containing protein [Kofleriaceae bacterium]
MRWASEIATAMRLEDALEEAAESVLAELGQQPDLVIAFISQAYADHFSSLPESLREHFPDALSFGSSVGGVIGSHAELEAQNGIVLMAAVLPDVEIQSFRLGSDPLKWEDEIGISEGTQDAQFLVITEPFGCDSNQLISWLDQRFPDCPKVGGIASGGQTAGDSILMENNTLYRTGAVGLAFRGNIKIDTVVAQGCRPIGSPMFVTRSVGNVLYEIDGQPAIAVLEQLFAGLKDDDRRLAHTSLFAGIGMNNDKEVYEHGDFLIRGILNVDPEARSIAVASMVRPGSIVQFHLRDAKTSAAEVKEMLTAAQNDNTQAALLFNCLGRGKELYGESNHDTKCFHDAMGDLPLAGFFGNGEIGPVSGQTFLHSYTAVFALFGPKES